LESYGSDEDFTITCEKSRRNVCGDHSSNPFKVLRTVRTDRNENRLKRLERVVWKYWLLPTE